MSDTSRGVQRVMGMLELFSHTTIPCSALTSVKYEGLIIIHSSKVSRDRISS